ncbi:hypothetical protein PN441_16395 [Spirulina major CS-329]|nr:hypothetical protein [Spirulina subsalsa]MDB9495848.1 hypothetical protein [Spirulina subsalsa CS-330]MDB9504660.1 hypothetical protein [Spirulina major CS-329]
MPKRRNILIAGAAFVGGLVGATQLPRLGKQEPDLFRRCYPLPRN